MDESGALLNSYISWLLLLLYIMLNSYRAWEEATEINSEENYKRRKECQLNH